MRNLLQEVYFGKTKDVVYDLRSVDSLEKAKKQRELQKELAGLLRKWFCEMNSVATGWQLYIYGVVVL